MAGRILANQDNREARGHIVVGFQRRDLLRKFFAQALGKRLAARFGFDYLDTGALYRGVALGVLVTLSSVGAGVLGTTMLLVLYPNTRAVRIVGTDIAHAVPLTLVAGLGHLALGTTDLGVLFLLLIGSLPGIYLGTRLGRRLPDRALRPIIAVFLVLIAISMIAKTLNA